MKKILTLSFILLSIFIPLQSWALPACPSNQNAYYHNCFGTYEWTSGKFKGDKYVGEWKDNKPNGRGKTKFPNGHKFEGEFKDGLTHNGTYTDGKGNEYTGEFKDGKEHGEGTETIDGGKVKYIGGFKNGLRHGDGTIIIDGVSSPITYQDGYPLVFDIK